jgi:hypothetical protein
MKVGLRPGCTMSANGMDITDTGMDTMSIMARTGIITDRRSGRVSSCIACAGRLASGLAHSAPVSVLLDAVI